jgi:hypothetical protein
MSIQKIIKTFVVVSLLSLGTAGVSWSEDAEQKDAGEKPSVDAAPPADAAPPTDAADEDASAEKSDTADEEKDAAAKD